MSRNGCSVLEPSVRSKGLNKTGTLRRNVALSRVQLTIVTVEKQEVLRILSVCVCATVTLVVKHAKNMHLVLLSSMTCVALLYFSTVSRKRYDFQRKKQNIKCVFQFLYNFSPKHFSF
jgi:hypothetical protein